MRGVDYDPAEFCEACPDDGGFCPLCEGVDDDRPRYAADRYTIPDDVWVER